MAFTNSDRQQFIGIVPDDPAIPTVPAHLQVIVDAIEPQVVLRAADWADANTNLAPFEDGMVLFKEDDDSLHLRAGAAWVKLHPKQYTGTGEPSPALGDDGDLYFQTA